MAQALAPEARVVARMDDPRRQTLEPPHGGEIGADVAAGDVIEDRPVVNGISGEERAARGFPQADAPRRMSGQVQHLERPVAEVDDIPLLHQSGSRRGRTYEAPQVEVGPRQRREEAFTDLVARTLQRSDELHRMI